MPVERRRPNAIAALVAGLLLLASTTAGLVLADPADADTAADEQLFVQLINQTRAGAGLPPLTVHPELTRQARAWSASMAGRDQLTHSSDISRGISAPWTALGENVGVHGVHDVAQLHAAFVASPGHNRNLVDPRYSHVGVGVVVTEDGKLWTTHRFMATGQPAPTTAPPTTRPATTAPPTTAPPTTAPPTTAPPTTATPDAVPEITVPEIMRPTSRPPDSSTAPATAPSTPTPDERAPAATADRREVEPVAAGPGRPDLATVEQMLIDLIEAGI